MEAHESMRSRAYENNKFGLNHGEKYPVRSTMKWVLARE
jgi:hypothetical protein